jgi:hypothetical protein
VALLCALVRCTADALAPGTPQEAIVSRLGGDPATMKTGRVVTERGVVPVTSFTARVPPADDVAALQSACDRSDPAAIAVGPVARGESCQFDGCAEGLWCIRRVCAEPPAR